MTTTVDYLYLDNWARQYRKKGSKGNKKICERCKKRHAVYYNKQSTKRRAKNRVRTGKFHTLCLRCYGEELDRQRGEREKEKEIKQKRREDAIANKEKLQSSFYDRGDDKRARKRSRKRWNKSRDLSRDAGLRKKRSSRYPNVEKNDK